MVEVFKGLEEYPFLNEEDYNNRVDWLIGETAEELSETEEFELYTCYEIEEALRACAYEDCGYLEYSEEDLREELKGIYGGIA